MATSASLHELRMLKRSAPRRPVWRRNPLHSFHFMQLEMPPDLLEVQRVMRVVL